MNTSFFRNKRVLVTGHTGFKGSWLSKILVNLDAEVTGYSLEPATDPNLFAISGIQDKVKSNFGDIRDLKRLQEVFEESRPEIVFHLAAQPIVREGYKNPVYTYETNVIGTANILECIRLFGGVRSFLNVTTDKVYKNKEWEWGYRENDPLDGFDPYSNSKSCSELVTESYKNSFFNEKNVAVSTARAGNVIGGGDFATDRIIPDCVRSIESQTPITVRNPHSIRPYQHVLEPLFVYLLIVEKQYENIEFSGCYNVGPDDRDCISTGKLVELFCEKWGDGVSWVSRPVEGPHEANFLKLDCSKLKSKFYWEPKWSVDIAVEKTIEWYKTYLVNGELSEIMDKQINEFFSL
ncbi:CDP-glucose 4,6-dehydratase [Paenibacillus puldeungensis]|uniref:CDP-glucose 4,6-dehydratase n=1 Tax=Paenibacillus puldeungensis TaxID=696536 RepID=A0ABW3S4L5_9BACL